MHTPLRTHRLAFVAAASLLSLSAQAETYTWTEGATAPWASTLSWTPMGIPTAGDWVEIPGVSTAEISGTCTVGGMDLWNVQLNGTSSDSTLSINSGDGSPSIVHSRQSSAIGIADNDPNLTLHLANPTAFYLYPNQNGSGSYPSIMYLSKLSGGTEEAPCDITLVRGRHFFRNASNNFRGNIIVGGENAGTQFFCGYRSSPAADTMLGHPDNIVYLSAGSRIAWQSSSDPLNHKVFGNGTIYGTNFDSWGNFTGANLYLGQDFEVRPETATSPFSSITIRNDFDYSKNSGTIHINPEATFSFNTGSTQADHIQVITYKAMEKIGRAHV